MMTNKLCTKCGEMKSLEVFYRDKRSADGRQYHCKECRNVAARKYEQTETGKALRAESNRKYNQTEAGRASQRRHNNRYPEKRVAQSAVNNAIQSGKLQKPRYCCVDSSECEGKIEGHHWDYGRPLDVTWLCKRHHRFAHQHVEGKS